MKNLSMITTAVLCAGAFWASSAFGGPTAPLSPKFVTMGDAIVNTAPGSTTLITHIDKDGNVSHETYTAPLTPEMIRARARYVDNARTYKLTVNSSADKSGNNAAPSVVYIMKDLYMFWESENTAVSTFDLPAGVYNIQVVYDDEEHSCVYFPNVELNDATNVDVNADMADKRVSFRMIMPDGSPLTLPDNNDPEAKYNTTQIACHQMVLVNGCSQWTHSITSSAGGANAYRSFTIKSNFGENTVCAWNALSWKSDFGNVGLSLTKSGTELKNGDKLNNEVENFYQIGAQFKHTPIYDEKGGDNGIVQMGIELYRPDGNVLSGFALNISDPSTFYICAPQINTDTFYTLAYLQDIDVNPKYGRKMGVYTPAIGKTSSGMLYVCNQANNTMYNVSDVPSRAAAPINPYFSFPFNPEYAMANSTPYAATGATKTTDSDTEYYKYSVGAYYGNYGENRLVDTNYYTEEATCNGDSIDLSKYRDVNAWLAEIAADPNHTKGKINISFIDANARIDSMPAKNVCTLSFTEGTPDVVPPTIQRMMLRNAEGTPAILFDKPENGSLAIAGGDFNPVYTPVYLGDYTPTFTTYDFGEATITVECAPTGSDDFMEIEMTPDAAKYVQSYGSYWEGSLKDVNMKSDNGWFDLRVTLVDKSGNSQTQLLSPAFYIESSMNQGGIDNVYEKAARLYVADGRILSSDGNEVAVYGLTGTRMANANLKQGVYIAVSGATATKIIVK